MKTIVGAARLTARKGGQAPFPFTRGSLPEWAETGFFSLAPVGPLPGRLEPCPAPWQGLAQLVLLLLFKLLQNRRQMPQNEQNRVLPSWPAKLGWKPREGQFSAMQSFNNRKIQRRLIGRSVTRDIPLLHRGIRLGRLGLNC